MPSSRAAASRLPAVALERGAYGLRVEQVVGVAPGGERGRRRALPVISSGRCPMPMSPSWQRMNARSMTFSSSRTFPGQSWASSSDSASGDDALDRPSLEPVEPLDELVGEQRDVLLAPAQRGQLDADHVDAVVEVLAEGALAPCAPPRSRLVAAITRTSVVSDRVDPSGS